MALAGSLSIGTCGAVFSCATCVSSCNYQACYVFVRESKVVVSQQHSPSRPGSMPNVVELRSSCGVISGVIVAPAPHSVTLKVSWFGRHLLTVYVYSASQGLRNA